MREFSWLRVFTLIIHTSSNINLGNSYEALVATENVSIFYELLLPDIATPRYYQPASYPKFVSKKEIEYAYLCPYTRTQDVHLIETIMSSTDQNFDYLRCLFKIPPPKNDEDATCSSEVLPLLTKDRYAVRQNKHPRSNVYDLGFYYCEQRTDQSSREIMLESPASAIETKLLKTYTIRFDHGKSRTLWTKHKVKSGILSESLSKSSHIQIIEETLSTDDFGFPKNSFSNIAKTYEKQKNKKYKMTAQVMVPPEDVVLQLWQKTIFHYANTNPLWDKLVPLMKAINDGIRKVAIVLDKEEDYLKNTLTIYTATYSAYRQTKLGKFKVNDFGWNIWCKFVFNRDKKQGVMIYLHNLPGSPPRKIPTPSPVATSAEVQENVHVEKECRVTLPCNVKTWSYQNADRSLNDLLGYAYCCPPDNDKIKELFGEEITKKLDILEMDYFIVQYYEKGIEKRDNPSSDSITSSEKSYYLRRNQEMLDSYGSESNDSFDYE